MRPDSVRIGMPVRLTADAARRYGETPETVYVVRAVTPRPGYRMPWITLDWTEPSFSVFGQVKPSDLRPALSAAWTEPTERNRPHA